MTGRSLEELAATGRAAGVDLDASWLAKAADAMDVWWDEVVALREVDLGYIGAHPAIEPRLHPQPSGVAYRAAGNGTEVRNFGGGPTIPGGPPTELADATATELIALFRSRQASPVEAMQATLARIERVDPSLNSVLTLIADSALAAAFESEARYRNGTNRSLEGVAIGIKDNIETAGIRTTGGSKVYANYVPTTDAAVVTRLKRAGAIIAAKLATTEFACGGAVNPWYGAVRNPWDLDRFAGSSSSGPGAATGGWLLPLSVGTDTLGSVRVPAICTGCVGMKPTYELVPRDGVMPLSWTMDHVGPLARSAEDVARALSVMAGSAVPYESLLGDGSLRGVRIGFARSYYDPLSSRDVVASLEHARLALTDAGAECVDVQVDHLEKAWAAGWIVTLAEGSSLHEGLWSHLEDYDPGLVFRLLIGKLAPATDYVRSLRIRALVQDGFARVFQNVDVIALPGMPGVAPRYDDLNFEIDGRRVPLQKMHARFTAAGNGTGLPGLVVPAGLSGGMPVSLQLYGPAQRDDLLLRVAHAFQQRTDHHRRVPTAIADLLRRSPVAQQPKAPSGSQPMAGQQSQQPSAGQPPAQQPLTHQPPAQQPLTHQPPAQQPSAQQPLAHQPPAQQPSAQQQ